MKPELAEKIFALIEAQSEAHPTGMEFEMAYQGRIAIDRIRFAIKQFGPHTEQLREVGLQLLDALQRLETADRRFQARSRLRLGREIGKAASSREAADRNEIPADQVNGRDRMQRQRTDRAD